MGRALEDISFEEWVRLVFDHPVSKPEWYWNEGCDCWYGTPTTTVAYLTRVFEHADQVLRSFTDSQLNQGLWFIASGACSNHMYALSDDSVPWPERRRGIQSIYCLYERCFAPRCSPHLSHLDEPGANPLNAVCYMWWDIAPLWSKPDDPSCAQMVEEVLGVMQRALTLESDACRESVLHGLGHWQLHFPDRVEKIVNDFINRSPGLRLELLHYAILARNGSVQ